MGFRLSEYISTVYYIPSGVGYGSKLTPAPYEKAQTSEEMIYMQAVRSSRQLSTEVLRMSAWFLSSSIVV